MCKLGKIRRRHWKERFKIITIAKFESNLLKANGDRAPRSCEIFQTFCRDGHWCWGASLGAQFSQVWGHNFPKYTLARVRRIQSTCHLQHLYLAMLPIWRRFFHYGVDRFSLTGPWKNRVPTTNTALYYLNAWDRLWKGGLKQVMISFPASREKIFRYSFQYRFRFASRPMRRNF